MPAGGNSRFRGYPARMSERQQLALILQMTSQEIVTAGENRQDTLSSQSSSRSSPLSHHRGSRNRWANKNGDSVVGHRKEECRRRSMMLNGFKQNSNGSNEATETQPSNETSAPDSPHSSSSETGTTAPPIVQHHQHNSTQNYQHSNSKINNYQYQQQSTCEKTFIGINQDAEERGDLCEMRRTPPQNKVDRSGTGQTGNSPRVTLRLNQVRSTRDDKKTTASSSRQSMSVTNPSQMETSAKSTSSTSTTSSPSMTTASSIGASAPPNISSGPGALQADNSDVYEFKSSKEATPVRGASSSPNPNPDKDKDAAKSSGGLNQASEAQPSSTGENATSPSSSGAGGGAETSTTGSPSAKRTYDAGNEEEQDEENRRKKRKESETNKDTKGSNLGRQSIGRTASGSNEKSDKVVSSVTASSFVEQCGKTGKQGATPSAGKLQQSSSSTTLDRKSPNSLTANSPKPINPSTNNNSKATSASTAALTTTSAAPATAPPESDSEDDRPKSSDSGSAPKVPPLKIVIPQTTSEQEQGTRNGKNQSTRGHQLPYVVASSNSNDSTDKDPSQSVSGTTSPTEVVGPAKVQEEKKDFAGAIHNEERSTHHQRVLRSSHRSGNGANGPGNSKDGSSNQSGNASFSNSSPLPAAALTDRSNNSSPQQQQQQPAQSQQQQQHQVPQQQQPQQQSQQQQQQQNNSPTPETTTLEPTKAAAADSNIPSIPAKSTSNAEKSEKNETNSSKNQKDTSENSENSSSSSSNTNTSAPAPAPVELHPRKRKMKPNKEAQQAAATAASNESNEAANTGAEVHPHDQPITNCYQLFLNIRKQIERRRKGLFPVQPKPPQGFKDYLMNRCTYVLAGNANKEPNVNPPVGLQGSMKDLYIEQEKERYRLRMQHVVEKEKLVLSVEQEILRVHGRAARALANQILPFSVCTILKDEEVYNVITPEQEEKDRNQRSRYNGRLFLSWLQDVDDKWEKIKEAMLLRHHNEAESLHAVQRMDWEWKLKEVGLCEFKATPQIDDLHVPIVHVSDDFDLLPA